MNNRDVALPCPATWTESPTTRRRWPRDRPLGGCGGQTERSIIPVRVDVGSWCGPRLQFLRARWWSTLTDRPRLAGRRRPGTRRLPQYVPISSKGPRRRGRRPARLVQGLPSASGMKPWRPRVRSQSGAGGAMPIVRPGRTFHAGSTAGRHSAPPPARRHRHAGTGTPGAEDDRAGGNRSGSVGSASCSPAPAHGRRNQVVEDDELHDPDHAVGEERRPMMASARPDCHPVGLAHIVAISPSPSRPASPTASGPKRHHLAPHVLLPLLPHAHLRLSS